MNDTGEPDRAAEAKRVFQRWRDQGAPGTPEGFLAAHEPLREWLAPLVAEMAADDPEPSATEIITRDPRTTHSATAVPEGVSVTAPYRS